MKSDVAGVGDKFFYSVTATANSKACLKLVNATSAQQPLNITLNGLGSGNHAVQVNALSAKTIWSTNTISDPERVVPARRKLSISGERFEHTLPGYSIEVLEFDLK